MKRNEINNLLCLTDSFNMFETFLEHCDELSPRVYWESLRYAYTCSDDIDRIYKANVKQCFSSTLAHKKYLMNSRERKLLKELQSKDEITVYRGMTIEERDSGDYGISWTLDKSVAEFFAKKYMRNISTNSIEKCIVERKVNPKDIHAIFLCRKESEVIL